MKYRVIILSKVKEDFNFSTEDYIDSTNKLVDMGINSKESLVYFLKIMLDKFEGFNYCILENMNIICSGALDPGDIEIIMG